MRIPANQLPLLDNAGSVSWSWQDEVEYCEFLDEHERQREWQHRANGCNFEHPYGSQRAECRYCGKKA